MATVLTIPTILNIARGSGYMVANDIARGALSGEKLDPRWALRLYLERKAVEWMWALAPAYEGLPARANYLYALCGGYGRMAAAVLAGGATGTVVTPTAPDPTSGSGTPGSFVYLIPITGADFNKTTLTEGRATRYDNPDIVGEQLEVYWNGVNRYLEAGEFAYTPTGINVLLEGFDALTSHADASFKIYIVHPNVTVGGTVVSGPGGESGGTSIAYEGDSTYALAANTVLDYLIVFPGAPATFKIGTTVGGEEVLVATGVEPSGTLISVRRYSISGETLYLSGLPAGSRITYFTTTPKLS
jgi:hypothetical protein